MSVSLRTFPLESEVGAVKFSTGQRLEEEHEQCKEGGSWGLSMSCYTFLDQRTQKRPRKHAVI